ncbi:MAG: ribosome maturation factor RimP [Bdellovibrionaceae bacterium]|nr:ribosome maturation factor RimP [Pseudobdellovibrionaceae bacterium]
MIENTNGGSDNRPSWLAQVESLASQIAEKEGCRLYDLEFSSRVLRVYIDKDPMAGIKDCESISRGLSEILDAGDIVPGEHYQLEVSTPGLERVLKKDWHFQGAIGKKVKLRTQKSFEALGVTVNQLKNAKSLEAELIKVENSILIFDFEGNDVRVPMSAVEKARVLFEFDKNEKKAKKQ